IELFGKYRRMLTPGLNFIIPIIERVAHKQSMRTRELQVSVETKTQDNVFVTVRVSVQYRVENKDAVYNAFYQLEDP
ncbi:MAG TPA: SPFH domain-containing protein, partial [Idiomarina baltica]|nr:SPFH domain-containing protein [Idiomarina baltica]